MAKTKYRWIVKDQVGGDDLNISYFSIEDSNKIIESYVNSIKDYEKSKKIKIEYKKMMDNEEKSRIRMVEIKGLDGLIEGRICYTPSGTSSYAPHYITSEKVNALIHFDSNNKKDIKEFFKFIKRRK